jgi:hypothetical protein
LVVDIFDAVASRYSWRSPRAQLDEFAAFSGFDG